jgi:hypothetical protein
MWGLKILRRGSRFANSGALAAEHLLDHGDDHHEHGAANASRCNLSDQCSDIEAACSCGSAASEQGAKNLTPDPAAQGTGDAVSGRAEAEVLEKPACYITPNCARYELNDDLYECRAHFCLHSLMNVKEKLTLFGKQSILMNIFG